RDCRYFRCRPPGSQRRAIKAATCIAESNLINTASAQCPRVLKRNAVSTRQRITGNAGWYDTAAVGQWRDGTRIVAQVGIAAKHPMTGIEIVIDAPSNLILVDPLISDTDIVVRHCLLPIYKHIRKWIAVDYCSSRRVDAICRDGVVQETVPDKSGTRLAGC